MMDASIVGAFVGLVAWMLWWRIMQGDSAPRALLITVALMVLGVVLPAFADTPGRKLALLGFAIALIILGVAWPRLASHWPPLAATARTIAVDARTWLAVFLLAWLYAATSQVILTIQRDRYAEIVEKDMIPFRRALERWVLPRRLTPEQIAAIANHLSKHRPYAVAFRVARNDEEAGGYRADLQRAVTDGGWRVTTIEYSDDVRAGLTTHFQQTMATQQAADDPRNPKPDRILDEALRSAGVQIDGGGGGSGVGITADMLAIHVGPRPRDTHGHMQKWWPF